MNKCTEYAMIPLSKYDPTPFNRSIRSGLANILPRMRLNTAMNDTFEIDLMIFPMIKDTSDVSVRMGFGSSVAVLRIPTAQPMVIAIAMIDKRLDNRVGENQFELHDDILLNGHVMRGIVCCGAVDLAA